MINSKDTSIEISNDYSILSKIIKFIKNIFKKDNIKYISAENGKKNNNRNYNSYLKSIKFEEDPEKTMLLKIQDDLEDMGIDRKNAYKLTKDLTDEQKIKLEKLYKEQIKEYQISINNYRNKIIGIRKKL